MTRPTRSPNVRPHSLPTAHPGRTSWSRSTAAKPVACELSHQRDLHPLPACAVSRGIPGLLSVQPTPSTAGRDPGPAPRLGPRLQVAGLRNTEGQKDGSGTHTQGHRHLQSAAQVQSGTIERMHWDKRRGDDKRARDGRRARGGNRGHDSKGNDDGTNHGDPAAPHRGRPLRVSVGDRRGAA